MSDEILLSAPNSGKSHSVLQDYSWPHFKKQDGGQEDFFYVADLKSAYICLIIGQRGMSSDVFRSSDGPLLEDQTRINKLKSDYNLLIIVSTR